MPRAALQDLFSVWATICRSAICPATPGCRCFPLALVSGSPVPPAYLALSEGSSSRSAAERLISVVPFPLGVPVPCCPRPSAGKPLLHAFHPAVWFPLMTGWVQFLFSRHSCGPESGARDLIHGPWALHLCLLTGLPRRCSVSGPPPHPIPHRTRRPCWVQQAAPGLWAQG